MTFGPTRQPAKIHFSLNTMRSLPTSILARGFGSAFVIRLTGAAMTLLLHIVLARLLGLDDFGVYIYVLSWVLVFTSVSTLGFDTCSVRFVAQYKVSEDWDLLATLLRHGAAHILLASSVLCVIALVFIHFSWRPEPPLAHAFTVGFVLLPILALSLLRQGALRGLQEVAAALTPDLLMRPILILLGVALVWYIAGSVSAVDAMFVHLLAALLALLTGFALLARKLPFSLAHAPALHEHPGWIRVALPLMVISGIQILMNQIDILMLGALLNTDASGMYSASARLAELMAFGLTSVNVVLAPLISKYYSQGQFSELRYAAIIAARISLGFSAVVGIVLVTFGRDVLELYGPTFVAALSPLMVLMIGQIVNTAAGSVGFLMTMTGRQNRAALILAGTLVVNVALNAALIPPYGMVGAAVATTTTLALWNLFMLWDIRSILGFIPIAFAHARSLAE